MEEIINATLTEETTEDVILEDMPMFYNKHYITVDEQNRIVNGFSDVFRQPSETDILLTDEGGYQFRLFPVGEENPALYVWPDMIPLYKWEDGKVVKRTEEEIEADRPETPEPEPTPQPEPSVWDELDASYQEGVNDV